MKYLKLFENFSINEAKVVNFNQKNGNFVVIGGGPGSGKSFVSENLINLDNYKYFNVDRFREFLAKKWWGDEWKEKISTDEGYDEILKASYTTSDPRNRTINFLRQFLQTDRRGELTNIMWDAGAGQTPVIEAIHNLAKEAGYETTIIYVETDEDVALQRNRKRDRSLPDEMVLDYRDKVNKAKEVR
jgi:dephospho-CoA kinase